MSRKQKIYYSVFFSCLVFSIVMTAVTGGSILRDQLLFYDAKDTFMDFFNSLKHSSIDRPYDYGVFYPPVAYLFYKVFAAFIPYRIVDTGGKAIRNSIQGQVSLIVYYVIFIALLIWVLFAFCKDKRSRIFTILAVITSAPFLFLYERGNLVLPTFILTVLFFLWKDDPKAWKRELALVALALAFGFKLYPAIFGILLIKDRKHREAVRCSIYAIVLFAVPFLLMGGAGAVASWAKGLSSAAGGGTGLYMGPGCKVSFKNTYTVLIVILITRKMTSAATAAAGILAWITAGAGLVSAFLTKDRIRCITLLCCVMIGIPSISYQYMMVFMAIPLILFLENGQKKGVREYIMLILFILMTVVLTLNVRQIGGIMKGQHDISVLHLAESLSVVAMTWFLSFESVLSKVRRK
ncbi:MAG: DUF2029 domain-containing protein [Clostridiales bacterium]|nr:DUF2029 domain-containing protein [Clostridiales bacterium]